VRPRKARGPDRCTALTIFRNAGGTRRISPIGRQAAAAIDNSTSIRYVRLGHPVKPGPGAPPRPRHLYTPCGQRLEPRTPP
jgi:hypothetical protein